MNVSVGQIILILLVGFLLFGNVPKRVEEITKGISKVFTRKEEEERKKE